MNSKHMGKWVIVLFLLAALPGMTAVMAQEQGRGVKAPLPPVMERGESATAFPWQNTESESNDSIAEADAFRNIQGGIIDRAGDVDYFQLYSSGSWEADMTRQNFHLLIDVEAQSLGSPLDPVICLYSDDLIELACNDDTDTLDSMLYYNVDSTRNYYLAVQAYRNQAGGSDYRYQILTSSPLLISAAAGGLGTGTVDGIPFQAGDILAWSRFHPGDKWVMLFDLSDLGVKGNLTNLSAGWRNSDFLLVGFAANVRLPGVSSVVTPWDVVVFDPSKVGPNTQGEFRSWWAGRNHYLTVAAEKLDAIEWLTTIGYARLYASTAGTASVFDNLGKPLKLADEDVGLWSQGGAGGSQYWERYTDFSLVPGLATEDVIALSYSKTYLGDDPDDFHDWTFHVLQGTARCEAVPNRLITQKDIVTLVRDWYQAPPDWSDTWSVCNLFWHGPDYGWNYNIDAINVTGKAFASWWDEDYR